MGVKGERTVCNATKDMDRESVVSKSVFVREGARREGARREGKKSDRKSVV